MVTDTICQINVRKDLIIHDPSVYKDSLSFRRGDIKYLNAVVWRETNPNQYRGQQKYRLISFRVTRAAHKLLFMLQMSCHACHASISNSMYKQLTRVPQPVRTLHIYDKFDRHHTKPLECDTQ